MSSINVNNPPPFGFGTPYQEWAKENILFIKRRLNYLNNQIGGGSGTVLSVFTRTGAISAQESDYSAFYELLSNKVQNLLSPDSTTYPSTDAVYNAIQSAIDSLNPHDSVEYATTTVLPDSPTYDNGTAGVGATLTAGANGALSIDGNSPTTNARVLVKNQAAPAQNGVYVVTDTGDGSNPYILTRSTDYDTSGEINNSVIPVLFGDDNEATSWAIITTVTTIGTDAITYSRFTYNPDLLVLNTAGLSQFPSSSTTAAELQALLSDKTIGFLENDNNWTGAQRGGTTELTDAATIAIDLGTTNNFRVVLTDNRTLGVPTNIVAGQGGVITVYQDAGGTNTLAFAWVYEFPGGTAPTLTTTGTAKDVLAYQVLNHNSSAAITGTNTTQVFNWTAHGMTTGDRLQFSAGTTTTPALSTTYWVNVVSDDTFNLATSQANLNAGTYITLSGVSGSLTAASTSILISTLSNVTLTP